MGGVEGVRRVEEEGVVAVDRSSQRKEKLQKQRQHFVVGII